MNPVMMRRHRRSSPVRPGLSAPGVTPLPTTSRRLLRALAAAVLGAGALFAGGCTAPCASVAHFSGLYSDTCNNCVVANCGTEIAAANEAVMRPACVNQFACTQNCRGVTNMNRGEVDCGCLEGCFTADECRRPAFDVLSCTARACESQCRSAPCAAVAGFTHLNSQACQDCTSMRCSSETMAVQMRFGSAECMSQFQCAGNCRGVSGDGLAPDCDCIDRCLTSTNCRQTTDSLFGCFARSCTAECM
jgi:hypothetical protein